MNSKTKECETCEDYEIPDSDTDMTLCKLKECPKTHKVTKEGYC